jgi:hypothetical protein
MGWTPFGELPRYIRVLDAKKTAELIGGPVPPELFYQASAGAGTKSVLVNSFGKDVTTLSGIASAQRSAQALVDRWPI